MGIDDIIAERQPESTSQEPQESAAQESSSDASPGGISLGGTYTVFGREFSMQELLLIAVAADIALTALVLERLSRRAVG